jgi:biopolymer transport protein ExbD
LVLFLVCVVLEASSRRPTIGLKIRLLRPGVEGERSPGIQPLRVHVGYDRLNRRPTITVNSQPVPWEDLAVALRRELWRRPPNWPVYLDGDPDMDWGNAVQAMDVIQGLHAQVVLLTR